MTEGVHSRSWLWNVWKICAPQRVIAALLSWPRLVLGERFCWQRISGGEQSVMKCLSLVRAKTDDPLIFCRSSSEQRIKPAGISVCWMILLFGDLYLCRSQQKNAGWMFFLNACPSIRGNLHICKDSYISHGSFPSQTLVCASEVSFRDCNITSLL